MSTSEELKAEWQRAEREAQDIMAAKDQTIADFRERLNEANRQATQAQQNWLASETVALPGDNGTEVTAEG